MISIQKLVSELRRRRVFRVAGFYIVGCWVVLQVAALGLQTLNIPETALRWVWIGAFIGFPVAIVFGWRYDLTSQGIIRTPPAERGEQVDLTLRRTDFVILGALALLAAVTIINIIDGIRDVPETVGGDFPDQSIAVLPLANFSGDPENAFFVSGMHEALIADLARISSLKVISRISTLQYAEATVPAREIGNALGVRYLVEGSVTREQGRVRISVQLIDAAEDENIWSESYERSLTNVLRLQSDLARAIANQVKVKLTPYEDQQLASERQVDPVAYELYLQGKFHWYQLSESNLKLALDYFQRSIDIDPDYAAAYVGFADALATPAHVGMMPTAPVFPAATRFVERALEIDGELAEAHDLRARIHFAYDWDWEAAERGFRRAISLKPGYPDVHVVYSQYLAIMNRPDESLAEAELGVRLDPLNPWFRAELAHRRAWYGDSEDALREFARLEERHPNLPALRQYHWEVAATSGQFGAAISAARAYFRLMGDPGVAEVLTDVASEADYRERMLAAARELEEHSARPYLSKVNLAKLRMHAGDHEAAMDLLDDALRQHESQLGYTAANPLFRPLWNTDRYKALRRKINL